MWAPDASAGLRRLKEPVFCTLLDFLAQRGCVFGLWVEVRNRLGLSRHTGLAALETANTARKQTIAKRPKPKTVLRLPDLEQSFQLIGRGRVFHS